jgi:hypothetical protein
MCKFMDASFVLYYNNNNDDDDDDDNNNNNNNNNVGTSHKANRLLLPVVQVQVQVTLRLTVSQSVCLGVEPRPGLMTRF